jgi:hypothetical protein
MSEAETTVVRQPGVAIGGLGVTRQVVISQGDQVAFETSIDSTTDIDDLMGLFRLQTEAIKRLRAEAELVEKRKALEVSHKMVKQLEDLMVDLRRGRMTTIAAQQASWANSRKKGEFRLTAAQETTLKDFDQKLENAEKSIEHYRLVDIPANEWEVACREARMRGEPEPLAPVAVEKHVLEMKLNPPEAA